ncbi:uncharacterized protein LOC111640950 [Centruroides sculpturatus]|uniref:uncharacterized protein LOC111640950 n=1 Tax=Centruroides sculpturatus TaxID=218467 RepID=UPI000C6E0CEC|nr:uncharacterized protein LOC111640950 [Centruroides sculpturatus]
MDLRYFITVSSLFVCIMASNSHCKDSHNDNDKSERRYDNFTVLRITPLTEGHVRLLVKFEEDLELDFWTKPSSINKSFDVMIPPEKINRMINILRENDINFYTLNDDIQK